MREQYINEAINEEIKKQLDLKIREDVSSLLKDSRFRRFYSYFMSLRQAENAVPRDATGTYYNLGQDSIIRIFDDFVSSSSRENKNLAEDEFKALITTFKIIGKKNVEERG